MALKYRSESNRAPEVTAIGRGGIAEKIIALAKEHHIYIHNDPDLIEILSQLDLNDEIPPDVYTVVAELLAFVYSLNEKAAGSVKRPEKDMV